MSEQLAADLIVLGAHGGNFFADIFLGNTADTMIRMSRRALLVVKNRPGHAYRKVLVPVDFSDDSLRAANMGLYIAPSAQFNFLHAGDVLIEEQFRYANSAQDDGHRCRVEAHEQARQDMNRFIARLGAGEHIVSRSITFGLPAPVIREHVAACKPDLIVMGNLGLLEVRSGKPFTARRATF
jgi:nucleotide-binding universal stress UspA family protein